MVLTKATIIVEDLIIMWKRLSSIQLDIMLKKASEARVNRSLRRYYLRFRTAVYCICSNLSSFEFDIVG